MHRLSQIPGVSLQMAPLQSTPRVFIGIPTLNRPQLVVETISSVYNQKFSDYRVIVSDNRSAGDAADIVERHIAGLGDPRFTFHRQPENCGEYGQGRFFFEASAGHEFFMILHDDDVLTPDYLDTAVRALDDHPIAALFVANPYAMDGGGERLLERTAQQLRDLGRGGAREGLFDVLGRHMEHGVGPISGTLFRREMLVASGFVDADCHGTFPFESNVFLRLGDIGAQGWLAPVELLGIRFHQSSLHGYLHLMDNPLVVRTTLRLFARRRYRGRLERRRRQVLSRLHRADASICLRQGDMRRARASLRCALWQNPCSPKAWGLAALMWLSPRLLCSMLPPLPTPRDAPDYGADKQSVLPRIAG